MKRDLDILHGSMWDKILLFALPLAATSMLQQLFNVADIAVVGRFTGDFSKTALAAVGANSAIINLLVNLFVGLSVGANAIIARYIGQGDEKRANEAVHTTMSISILGSLFLLVFAQIFARPVLTLIGTPPDVIEYAILYFRIYFAGIPFIMLYNFESAILRSKGDTKRPLLALTISGVINIFLNLFFVIVCKMTVDGVATATVLSNIVSSMLLLHYLRHEEGCLKFEIKKLHIHKSILKKIAEIGIPSGVQGMLFSISNIVVQSAINDLGSTVMAANTVGQNFDFFIYFVVNAFNQTAVTFTSQNYGAGYMDRCRRTTKWSFILGAAATVLVSAFLIIFRKSLVYIFTTDPQIAELAYRRMLIILAFELVNLIIEILSGVMRGLGHSLFPAVACIFGICGVRLAYVYTIYPRIASYDNLIWVYPISWAFAATALMVFYIIKVRPMYKTSTPRN